MDSSDRRRDVRAHASPPAQILRVGSAERIEILNASYRGLFIRTNTPPPLNQLLRIRIELPTKTVELNGVPVRVVADGSGRAGIGVRFFALNGEDKRFWESYITSLLSPRRMAA
ncbi:MAG: PilZ domain-containing protein [Labilithrix sp.]|nr:PilZ domain-containing protein [Labilithrix sp.]MBX3221650.1 PilZ domain-containing protein [Labilithrix sp.]